jgi:dynein heavy chain, axonemal
MKFSNIPKFVKADIPLFTALIFDLFPTTEQPPPVKSKLLEVIPDELKKAGLQPCPAFEQKIIQLYDTFNVRFGVMLVGQSGSGKSTCFKMLAQCSTHMKEVG